MEITLKFFARLREIVGQETINRTYPEGTTVGTVLKSLQHEYPSLSHHLNSTIVSVNHEFASAEDILQAGDEVALFPPVSGGSGSTTAKVRVTHDPISLDAVAAQVVKPKTGAVAVFSGVVRDNSAGKAVQSLEYEAYTAMALEKMNQVVTEARQQWPNIVDIAIVQRIGHLEIGETAVIVAVSSPHRGDGCFEACRFAIDRLKQIVPIWKKEVSPTGSTWVEGDYQPTPADNH